MGHTPGPWTIEYEDDDGNEYDDGVRIDSPEGPVAFNVIDCSAPLIAAAPELLSALKATHGWLAELSALVADGNLQAAEDWVAGNSDWIAFYEDQNDGIIAKAEGRDANT